MTTQCRRQIGIVLLIGSVVLSAALPLLWVPLVDFQMNDWSASDNPGPPPPTGATTAFVFSGVVTPHWALVFPISLGFGGLLFLFDTKSPPPRPPII